MLSIDSKIQIHLKPSSGRLLFSKAGHHGWRRHRISVLSLWFLSKTKCDRQDKRREIEPEQRYLTELPHCVTLALQIGQKWRP